MYEQEYPVVDAEGIRLLLVDDDIILLELTSQLLYRKGYIVTPVTGSDEAINILKNNHKSYDVVVTDLAMSEDNGIELAKKIKEISTDIPVILNTAKIDLVDESQMARVGINEIVTKPYRIEELDKIIRKVIKEHRKKQA